MGIAGLTLRYSTQHRLSRPVFSVRMVLQRRGGGISGAPSSVALSALAVAWLSETVGVCRHRERSLQEE